MTTTKTHGELTVTSLPVPVVPDIFVVEGQFRLVPGLILPLRMTVIRLPNSNDLVVYSPFHPDLVELSHIGRVTAVIAPNAMHSTYAQMFADAHPDATLYSSPGLPERFPERDWGMVLNDKTPLDVISPHAQVRILTGMKGSKEVLLLHVPSGTLLGADIAFHFTPHVLDSMTFLSRSYIRLTGGTVPLGWSVVVKWLFKSSCSAMLPQLNAVMEEWQWGRFVPCHGAIYEKDAKSAFRKGTYRYVKDVVEGDQKDRGWILLVGATIALVAAVVVRYRWRL